MEKENNIKLKFPDGEEYTFETGKPLVILGANGSGKTRFSIKVEELNAKRYTANDREREIFIHRISAQKSLSIPQDIDLKTYNDSKSTLYYGSSTPDAFKHHFKYHSNPAITQINDYNHLFSFLFSTDRIEFNKWNKEYKELYEKLTEKMKPFISYSEKVQNIWNELLPKRGLSLENESVSVKTNNSSYHGKEMSDGERAILYIIAQVILLEKNSVIIIDEPEQHVHKSILKRLWDKLECVKNDCNFIYITHDLDFAVSRNKDKILWVKDFDGKDKWEYEFVNLEDFFDIPQELIFEIIGSNKKILFVEGRKESLDFKLYKELYQEKGYHVIPVGGCNEVINYVKSNRIYEKLNTIDVIGIIDRDFRTENEIKKLEKEKIYTLKVAEIENLFFTRKLFDVVREHIGINDNKITENYENTIKDFYLKNRKDQLGEAIKTEIKNELKNYQTDFSETDPKKISEKISEKFTEDFIQEIKNKKEEIFSEKDDIDDILSVFNDKRLSDIVGSLLGLKGRKYPERVINLLRTNPGGVREKIINALCPYLPDLPGSS